MAEAKQQGGVFKQLGGIYRATPGGPKFKKGAVIKSDKDLDVLFAGMFERLEGKTRRGRDEVITPMPKNTLPPTVAAKMMNKNPTGLKGAKTIKEMKAEEEANKEDEDLIITDVEEEIPQDEEEIEAPSDDEDQGTEDEPVEEVEDEPEPEEEPEPEPKPKRKAAPKKKK